MDSHDLLKEQTSVYSGLFFGHHFTCWFRLNISPSFQFGTAMDSHDLLKEQTSIFSGLFFGHHFVLISFKYLSFFSVWNGDGFSWFVERTNINFLRFILRSSFHMLISFEYLSFFSVLILVIFRVLWLLSSNEQKFQVRNEFSCHSYLTLYELSKLQIGRLMFL